MDYLEKKIGVTPLAGFAFKMHEIYTAFINAGFNSEQAMELLLQIAGKDRLDK
jgi:hypothetical protein